MNHDDFIDYVRRRSSDKVLEEARLYFELAEGTPWEQIFIHIEAEEKRCRKLTNIS